MSSRKEYRSWSPRQAFLVPPSPLEWLPEGHLAYFILDVLEELDLSPIEEVLQGKAWRGTRPYAPKMMVGLLLYGYSAGVFSSRKLERATYEDVAFRVLSGGEHPHFTTINRFRVDHLKALSGLFLQVLRLCQTAGMVKFGHMALDGTKVQANASKHKAMSYERMLKSELRLTEEIAELLARASEIDQGEDARFGEGQRDEDLPTELRLREGRLTKIREAKEKLEAEAAKARARVLREQARRGRACASADESARKRESTKAEKKEEQARELDPDGDDDDLDPPKTGDGLPKHEPRTTTDGKPHGKAQMSFTDSDSRLMESGGAFLQAYNCQAMVADGAQVIVAQAVSNQAPDNGNLEPLVTQTLVNCGQAARVTTADAGYWHPAAPDACEALQTDVYISTRRERPGRATSPTGTANEALRKMRAKLSSGEGRRIYARRKAVVEPVFGQIKEARGFRRFLLRGLPKVGHEWALVCTGHNLLKLWRHSALQPA